MKGGRKGRIGEEGREQRKEVVVKPEGLTEWKREEGTKEGQEQEMVLGGG